MGQVGLGWARLFRSDQVRLGPARSSKAFDFYFNF